MTGPLTKLRNKFSKRSQQQAESDTEDDRPKTVLHECTACGSVFIQHSGERCSECGTGTLIEQ